ncbi:hypothetical protein Hte_000613 [Hypoxylon texense]
MKSLVFFAFLFARDILAAPSPMLANEDNDAAVCDLNKPTGIDANATATTTTTGAGAGALKLHKRDEIDDWNHAHPNNRIAGVFACPDMRRLYTVFNSHAVWDAFRRGAWYLQHPREERPRWAGLAYPHGVYLPDYHGAPRRRRRGPGRALGVPAHAQPGQRVARAPPAPPSRAPPGDHRVLFDERGTFAGVVVVIQRGEPDGERLAWCYPLLEHGDLAVRDFGATAEGFPGVDEFWVDDFDGHYLYAPDPQFGSRPPGPEPPPHFDDDKEGMH